jgi:hypothetical protein
MTYVVVVFSILVQGLTVGRLTRTLGHRAAIAAEASTSAVDRLRDPPGARRGILPRGAGLVTMRRSV